MFALNLSEDGRILSATLPEYAPESQPRVETLPEGDISDYRYVNGEFVYDPLPKSEDTDSTPTLQEDTDSMLVDHEYRLTLLELGLTE